MDFASTTRGPPDAEATRGHHGAGPVAGEPDPHAGGELIRHHLADVVTGALVLGPGLPSPTMSVVPVVTA
ncbi:hypothetical protein GY12_13465 [Micrococcus luteus]|nr:hypothetical protein GY12_13465 [Micrococcus luteus]